MHPMPCLQYHTNTQRAKNEFHSALHLGPLSEGYITCCSVCLSLFFYLQDGATSASPAYLRVIRRPR